MSNPIYISQLAFTTGEVSPDVSSRFDLEQYKSALLEAENVVIRPYGAVAVSYTHLTLPTNREV